MDRGTHYRRPKQFSLGLRARFRINTCFFLEKMCKFPWIGVPKYRPHNSTVLIAVAPNEIHLIRGSPQMFVFSNSAA